MDSDLGLHLLHMHINRAFDIKSTLSRKTTVNVTNFVRSNFVNSIQRHAYHFKILD